MTKILTLCRKYGFIVVTALLTFGIATIALAIEEQTPKAFETYKMAANQLWAAQYGFCVSEKNLAEAKLTDYHNDLRPLTNQESEMALVEKSKKDCSGILLLVEENKPVDPKLSSGNFTPTTTGGIDDFLKVNGATFTKEAGDLFRAAGLINKVKPEILVCIAQADSSLGKALKSSYNIGNVGNRDDGSVMHYATLEEGINRIGLALNNQYMKGNLTLGQLSQGGRNVLKSKYPCSASASPYKCYASSEYNWNKNTKLCLQNILQDPTIDENFEFRTNITPSTNDKQFQNTTRAKVPFISRLP